MVGLTPLGYLLTGVAQRPGFDQLFDVGAVFAPKDEPVVVLLIHQVAGHAVAVHPGPQVVPGFLGVCGDADVAVLALPGGDELAAVPEPAAHGVLAGVVVSGVHVLGGGGHCFLHRHVDMLALPGRQTVKQGDQYADVRPVGGGLVSLQAPELIGRGVGPAGHIHVAAHGEAHQVAATVVAVGPGLPEGSQRGVDETKIAVPQLLVPQTQGVQVAGPERLQYHVGLSSQTAKQGASSIRCDIEGDAALVGVVMPPVDAVLWRISSFYVRACPTHGVAAWGLHLDDICPHVGQQLAAIHAQIAGQV